MKPCHEAVDVADRGWTRKFVQKSRDHKVRARAVRETNRKRTGKRRSRLLPRSGSSPAPAVAAVCTPSRRG